tara:strand:+ start:1610 stop:2935 length:1326 start_codon:yes stop_codon:yes gene_type:complete
MRLFYFLIILLLFQNCSFDNKTGIWKNDNISSDKKNDLFKDFEDLTISNKSFSDTIIIKESFKFSLPNSKINDSWKDIFYSKSNNSENFRYSDSNRLYLKSKKLSKFEVNNYILFDKNHLIATDVRGNIIIFSVDQNKVISKFNFYKNKYKKVKKSLNIILENDILYVTDNIGYLYALNYVENKIIWAKNYNVPFRSNLKIFQNKLIASNQNNNLFFFNKNNGSTLKSILTEETIVKNNFINNLSIKNNTLFFLNTYGSLYSINIKKMSINWIINLNPSLDVSSNNLFFGNKIVYHEDFLSVSSNKTTYIIDSESGTIIHKKNFSSFLKPIMIDNYLFLITKNDLLIAMDLVSGEIIYSYDINKKIADFLDTKKKKAIFKNFAILNENIYIFLNNSYVLKLNANGSIIDIYQFDAKIKTKPIFIDSSIIFVDEKKRVIIVN